MILRIFDPEAWRQLFQAETWRLLLQSDFNRGYIAALVLFMALFLALMILRLILWFAFFRTHRCSEIVVPRRDGDIVVSRDAVTMAVSRELEAFPELDVRSIRLYRRGKTYLMTLFCIYEGGGGIPALSDELKPRVLDSLKRIFGIVSLKRIKLVVEKMHAPAPQPVEPKERKEPAAAETSAADGK